LTGHTIDHLVATIAFIGAMFLFIGLFTQSLQAAVLYQQNRHVALKASDLLDNILLSPGYPYHWGETNTTLSCFGLQQPESRGYTLSPFALMRLMSISGEPVEYPVDSGIWYSNVSWGLGGGHLLMPVSGCVDYATASRLLGVNGSYGFQLSITQTLNVLVSNASEEDAPLKLKVNVGGSGGILSGASLTCHLFWAYGLDPDGHPLFKSTVKNGVTDHAGNAVLDFSEDGVDSSKTYFAVVNARLGGLYGTGCFTHTTTERWVGIIPFIESFEEGTVLLTHSWNVHEFPNPRALFYTAAFYAFTEDWDIVQIPIENSTGKVNYGALGFNRTRLPQRPGVLIVVYRTGNNYGMSVMPWGIYTLGVSILFGGNPAGNVWVATDLRQVTVSEVAYQAKIACWSLQGYQTSKPSGRW
jgi:hypothetical protein